MGLSKYTEILTISSVNCIEIAAGCSTSASKNSTEILTTIICVDGPKALEATILLVSIKRNNLWQQLIISSWCRALILSLFSANQFSARHLNKRCQQKGSIEISNLKWLGFSFAFEWTIFSWLFEQKPKYQLCKTMIEKGKCFELFS